MTEKGKDFVFSRARAGERTEADGSQGERMKAKALFTAEKWNWVLEANEQVVGWSRPNYGMSSA